MTGRSVLLWVVLPLLVLAGLALWWTRPLPPPPAAPEAPRAEAPSAPSLPGHEPRVLAPPPAFPSSRTDPLGLPQGTPSSALARSEEAARQARREEALEESLVAQATQDPLAREELRVALRTLRPLLQQCFEDMASRPPGPRSATLRFTVRSSEGQGRLSGQLLEASVQDPLLHACLEDSLLDARFPAPRRAEGLTLTYPYRLGPTSQPGRVGSPPEAAGEGAGEAPSGR